MSASKRLAEEVCCRPKKKWLRADVINRGNELGISASTSLKAMSAHEYIQGFPATKKVGDSYEYYQFVPPSVKTTPYAKEVGKLTLYASIVIFTMVGMASTVDSFIAMVRSW